LWSVQHNITLTLRINALRSAQGPLVEVAPQAVSKVGSETRSTHLVEGGISYSPHPLQ
jgi:hypothetical protein